MFKNIKKSLKYFIIIIGVIIMLPTILYLVLQIPEVQTFLVKRVTKHISVEIKSGISVGKIHYNFFNKLVINDVLIKDKNNDTLLYSKALMADIKKIDIKNKSFRLGRVTLIKPVVKFITDSSGLMNLNWYLDLLKNSSDTSKKTNSQFFIDQIDISDASFSLINHTGQKSKTKIDFNNLKLKSLNGIIEDIKIQNDTASFNIYSLGFIESCGFKVKRMSSSVILARQNILFKSAFIYCDSSIINISRFGLIADSSDSFRRFTQKVKLDLLLEKSLISTVDLQYFVPALKEVNESVWLSGKISGTVSELKGHNIKLSYRDYTHLDCDFDFSGLPDIENTYMYIGVNSLETNVRDIEKINVPGRGFIIMPESLYKLGNITFDGSFTGFTTDFVTYGMIRTRMGNIRTDISLRPEGSKKYRIQGLLTGNDIDLGGLTGKPEFLGKLSMRTNVDGYADSLKKFDGNLTGKIDSIEINKYMYRNITLNGYFTEKTWDGSINIVDKNIKLDLLGLLNFKEKLPKFDFTLDLAYANLYKLNFDRIDTSSSLSMLLTSNFKGNSIDNIDGEIRLINSKLRKFNNTLELTNFSIKAYKDNKMPVLSLRTDFVDADIRGYYNFAAIGELIKSTLSTLMPSQFPVSIKRNDLKKNDFTFQINFKNTDKINSFFRTGVLLADKSYINGTIVPDSLIRVEGQAESLSIKNNVFKDFSLDANVSRSELSTGIKSSSLILIGQSELKDFSVNLKTKPDNFIFTVNWDNKDTILNRGNIIARGSFAKKTSGEGNAILTIDMDSTDIYSSNNLWKISQSSILVDSNAILINKLYISNKDRYYLIDGSVSENPSDTLHLEFNGIDIAPLNFIVNQKRGNDPNLVPLDFKGSLKGKIVLTNVYRNLLLESNIVVNDFSVLGSGFGDISVISALDINRKVVNINASNDLSGAKMFDISGYYDPVLKKIDLSANASKLPIDFLNPLLRVFASGIKGTVSGKANFIGIQNNLVLTGAVMAENASMKINYLQTTYRLNDTIRFDKEGFKFNNVRITDIKGNIATLSGSVNHKNFRDYIADLIINTNKNDFLVLNTQVKDNQLFYGTVYASGVTKIKSGPNLLSFNISAKTGKNTKFYIPLTKGLSVSDYSFITFSDSSVVQQDDQETDNINPAPSASQIGMELNIDLEATPDAEAQIIFDSKVGDKMTGRGSGILNVNLNRTGEFKIAGDYIIEDGEYLFTAGNILNKKFAVENGGKIMFNGIIDNAEIELKAIYKNLETSLAPILGDFYNQRVRVEPQLNLSGKLFNPIVKFDIYLPSADEETRALLKNAITSEEELNRQFLYLLVMNSFYYQSSATSTSTSAMAVTTTEMISTQLSNWISQISKDFDLGFVYRPGTGNKDINPQDLQVALSTQLLNDKVTINSNFDFWGAGSTPSNTNPITGDFDIEYKITEKVRFKVFNRFNNPYEGMNEPYTQGIGIVFKRDFNKFRDLFRRKVKADMKKEDETTVKEK